MTISKEKSRIMISLHNDVISIIDNMSDYFHLTRSDVIQIAVIKLSEKITGEQKADFSLTNPVTER